MANEYMQINFKTEQEPKIISLISPTTEAIMVSFNTNTMTKMDRILISGSLQEMENEEYIRQYGSEAAFTAYFNFFENLWNTLRVIPCDTIENIQFYKDGAMLFCSSKQIAKFTYDLNIFSQRATIQIDHARSPQQIINMIEEE